MSICNPLGYDSLECLYMHDPAWPGLLPLFVHFCIVLLCIMYDFWAVSPPRWDLWLMPKATPRLLESSSAPTLRPFPLLLLSLPPPLILDNLNRDLLLFHFLAPLLALFFLSPALPANS